MKRVLVVLVVLFTILLGYQDVSANEQSTSTNIHNMINSKERIKYDEVSDKYYVDQSIPIKADEQYTIVFSYQFIGGMAMIDEGFMFDRSLESRFVSYNDSILPYNLMVDIDITGIYYVTFNITQDCELWLDDLLVDQIIEDDSLYDEFMIYQGTMDDYVGFDTYYDNDTEFVGANKEIPIYVSSKEKVLESNIRNYIVAYDGVDGNLTDVIDLVTDEYTDNEQTPGSYDLIYSVSDTKGNKSTLTLVVNVMDKIAPTLTGNAEVIWNMSEGEMVTEESIKSTLKAKDETDDVTDEIYVLESNLPKVETNVEGIYEIKYAVNDNSGNLSTLTVKVNVIDDIDPIITAHDIDVYLSQNNFQYADIVRTISYKDNSNKFAPNPLQTYDLNNFNQNYKVPGVYEMKLTVTDAAMNTAEKHIFITVIDDISPNFYIGNLILNATVDNPLNVDSLTEVIKKNINLLNERFSNFEIISTKYFENSNNVGSYDVNYKYEVDGEIKYEKATINVANKDIKNYNEYYWLTAIIPLTIGWVIYIKRKNKISL